MRENSIRSGIAEPSEREKDKVCTCGGGRKDELYPTEIGLRTACHSSAVSGTILKVTLSRATVQS